MNGGADEARLSLTVVGRGVDYVQWIRMTFKELNRRNEVI